MAILTLLIFLVIIPVIIGLAGAKMISLKGVKIWLAALPLGLFVELAIFQLLAFPWSLVNFSFSSLCVVFICALSVCSFFFNSILQKNRNTSPEHTIQAVGLVLWERCNCSNWITSI